MRLDDQRESSNVEDMRSASSGGGFGGRTIGIGGVIIALVASYFFGVDPSVLIGMMGGSVGSLDLGAIMGKRLVITGTTLRRTPLDQKVALAKAVADFALPRFANGSLKSIVDSVLPLAEAAEAHRRMEANLNIGKIVLSV